MRGEKGGGAVEVGLRWLQASAMQHKQENRERERVEGFDQSLVEEIKTEGEKN